MANFSYTARTKDGQINQGGLVAADRPAAATMLTDQGLTPILIKEAGSAKSKLSGIKIPLLKSKGKVKTMEKVIFARQFATMINAGVPIVQALAILKEQTTSKKFQAVIGDVAKRVQGGSTLAAALGEHPTVFSGIYVNMVKAGETGGILDQVLERLAVQQEKDAEIVSKIKGAMIYPAVVTTITVGAFFFLMTVIVPKLAVVFEDLGSNIPVYTKVMFALSRALTHYGIFIAVAAAGVGYGLFRFVKTKRGKRIFDSLILKAPIFGKIIVKVNVARFARTFGSLLSSGIGVIDALNATGTALGNTLYKEDLAKLADQVKNGKALAIPLKTMKNFPPIVAQMVSVGEETGQLDTILLKLADFYEKEVDTVIAGLTSIIEPILIIVLGFMVGSIVLSVFGPLANLTNSIN